MPAAEVGFFGLPLELRQNIYLQYLLIIYRPTAWMLYKSTHTDNSSPGTPFAGVSKQFHKVLMNVLRQQQDFCYKISSQEAAFDGLALSCFRVLDRTMNYDDIQDLRVEIYPPHPDRPIDMVTIWKGVQKLSHGLRAAPVVPSLSVYIIEDELAAWSTNGEPHDTMKVMLWTKESTNCDVAFVLDVFARLTNTHKDLQRFAQATQDSMTNIHPFDQQPVEANYWLLARDIECNESDIKAATGRRSAAKLDAFYGDDAKVSYVTLEKVEVLWPHIDDMEGGEYGAAYKYMDWRCGYCTEAERASGHSTYNERFAERMYGKPPWI